MGTYFLGYAEGRPSVNHFEGVKALFLNLVSRTWQGTVGKGKPTFATILAGTAHTPNIE